MGRVPNVLECSHGLSGGNDSFFDIIIVAQTKGDEGAKVFEVATEGDISVFNLDGLHLVQFFVDCSFSSACRSSSVSASSV